MPTSARSVVAAIFVLAASLHKSQTIINAYANVTAIAGNSVLTVSSVDQTNHTFVVGENVIVMQMQDSIISNNSNGSSFGDLGSIRSAGLFEVKTVAALSPTTGTPTQITLTTTLSNTYNFGTNSNVQIITFRNMGNNYTTTSNLAPKAWNGTTGGVIAFYSNGVLTLNHRVLADASGFQGGAVSSNAAGDLTCVNTSYAVTTNYLGSKGEGVFRRGAAYQRYGRGHIATGGGGGSENNAGGGGGSNYSAGGNGGLGYSCNSSNSGYGLGGSALSASISASRIFMGGGGGSGQGNNGVQTAGGNGGGIIIIKTNTLTTNTTCTASIMLSASGATAANSGNDGAGGGGAGGTILIQANAFSINSSCPITFAASGGNGGTVGNAGSHGGGGGGGQGAVIFSTAIPTLNTTTQTNNGAAGADNSGGTVTGTSGGGTSNSGIIGSSTGPLPVTLTNFTAEAGVDIITLNWSTATEQNSKAFSVEKLFADGNYHAIGEVNAAGFSILPKHYSFTDHTPIAGANYYRLKQEDKDGSSSIYRTISLFYGGKASVVVFPNPMQQGSQLTLESDRLAGQVVVRNIYGAQIFSGSTIELTLRSAGFSPGIYVIEFPDMPDVRPIKLVVN